MLLNRRTAIAFIVLGELIHLPENEKLTAREISEKFGTQFDATSKVMQKLAGEGYINAILGVQGGYIPNRNFVKNSNPSEIVKLFNSQRDFENNLKLTEAAMWLVDEMFENLDLDNLYDFTKSLWKKL